MDKPIYEMSIDELIHANPNLEKLAHAVIQHLLGNKRMDIADWDAHRRNSTKKKDTKDKVLKVCNDEDVENLKAQIQAYAAKLKEYGAQAVVITCSFEQLQADGSGRGHNRTSYMDGNFFKCLGLVEILRDSYLQSNHE